LQTNRVYTREPWYYFDDASGSDILVILGKTKRGISLKVFLFSIKNSSEKNNFHFLTNRKHSVSQ